jgi:nicotinic acid phosphoribosyltransferase
MTGDLLLQNNRTALVDSYQMERVLADIDANRADAWKYVRR